MNKINHGAVWASVVLLFGLGFLWYSLLFGARWMEMAGLTMEDADAAGAAVWVTNTISTVLMVYGLAWLLGKLQVSSGMEGAMMGLFIAFVFVMMPRMTNDMFAQNPYGLSWIVGGFSMAALTLSGFVLGAWRKKGSGATSMASGPASAAEAQESETDPTGEE